MIRVLVADDQGLVRTGIRKILESEVDIEVVAEAGTGDEAVRVTRQLAPDVVLMDIRMPGLNGLDATQTIVAQGSTTRVVILTTFDLDEYVYRALRVGACGFLLKTSPATQLIEAIHAAVDGDALLAPSVTRRVIDEFARHPSSTGVVPSLDGLTQRELEVLQQVARGLANAEIAEALHLAPATVKTHVANLLQKLGVRDRVELVIRSYESGLVKPGG